MSQLMLDQLQCPVCIDTLNKPIRILSCGHNLCQRCLVDLCRLKESPRCSTCQQVIELGQNRVESLPRNHEVENMIERLSTDLNQKATINLSLRTSSDKFSNEEIKKLEDMAITYMQDLKWKKAADILKTFVEEEEGIYKVPLATLRMKCLLQSDEIEEVKAIFDATILIIDSSDEKDIAIAFKSCYEELINIAKIFIDKSLVDMAISLVTYLFKIIQIVFEENRKLIKLRELGIVIQRLSIQMKSLNQIKQIKPLLILMENILEEMQKTSNDDVKAKCLEVTWLLKYYGYCCNCVKDYAKSVNIHKQAIDGMKTVFGENACKYKVHGHCYVNLSFTFRYLNQFEDRKASCTEAIKIYNSAGDWIDINQKAESILLATNNLK